MSRSATTGLYTRVDNSFSNPVLGTTISPTDADTFFDDVEASMNSFIATSTTSLAIGTGTKTFTVVSPSTKVFFPNAQIHAFSVSNTANYMDCNVTSFNTSTGALVTDCFGTGGSGTITDWVIVSSGARGGTGATGATGDKAGFKYTFNSATSGDPGSGKFLFDNATFASATAFNISETDGESIALSSLLATLDDGTSTNKCLLVWVNADGSKGFIGYLTGTITDNGTYDTFSFTPVTSWGSPANNDVFRFQPFRVGDKGADGAGTGDVTAASTFGTDNRVIRSDGTSKGVQASGVTLDDSVNMSGIAALSTTTIELGHASDTTLSRVSAGVVAVEGVNVLTTATGAAQGRQTIFIPAAAMTARTTNGAAPGTVETSTNKNMFKTLDFDTTTQEFSQFEVWFPKSWNLGTVTFQPMWSHASTTTNFGVAFGLAGVARSDGDAGDVAFGTAQTSVDTGGTTDTIYLGPESSAITIAGTPAAGDSVQFQINRTVADAGDTMAIDARLHGIRLFFTTNASTDT